MSADSYDRAEMLHAALVFAAIEAAASRRLLLSGLSALAEQRRRVERAMAALALATKRLVDARERLDEIVDVLNALATIHDERADAVQAARRALGMQPAEKATRRRAA